MTISLKHATLTSESPSGPGGTITAAEWDEAHDLTMAADRLLGRTTSGTGAVEEISVGSGLSLAAGVLSASGGGGGGDPFIRRPMFFAVGGGSSLYISGSPGGTQSFSDTGTKAGNIVANAVDYTKFTTAATANATASTSIVMEDYIPPLSGRGLAGRGISAALTFPDANYGSGATGARAAFGIIRVVGNAFGGDDGTSGSNNSQGIWFSYSTNRGANWHIVINSAVGTVSTVDTGVPFAVGSWAFAIDFKEDAAEFDWRIRQPGSTAASGTVTNAANTFPANTATTYFLFAGIATLTTTARSFGVVRLGVDQLDPL